MKKQLADELLEFLWRVRCGRKNDKAMRSDALVLALRVSQLQNDSPQLVEKIFEKAKWEVPASWAATVHPLRRRLVQ